MSADPSRRWNAPKRMYASVSAPSNIAPMTDLHGEAAEVSCPPYMKGVVQILREKGHAVAVRRSARNGSWYYSVDGDRERLGGPLCRIFARYGV